MITVARAVQDIVKSSDFAIEGLESGCLNLSAYAEIIHHEVEKLAKKEVQRGSIIMSLSRLSSAYYKKPRQEPNYQLHNLVSRTDLTELAYPKIAETQHLVAQLQGLSEIKTAPFFVTTIGINEIAIVTNSRLADLVQREFADLQPSLHLDNLSSLTMQVAIETIDMPRQSYTVIKQLALRDITIVEYITSPTELTIVLHSEDLKEAFVILHDKFFAG